MKSPFQLTGLDVAYTKFRAKTSKKVKMMKPTWFDPQNTPKDALLLNEILRKKLETYDNWDYPPEITRQRRNCLLAFLAAWQMKRARVFMRF
jgi:hypothetical protein